MIILQIIILLILLVLIYGVFSSRKASPKAVKGMKSSVVLDSCAVIDGRVVELAKLGFLPGNVIVPEFIVKELQLLADGRDAHKRERSRYGLQVIQELQALSNLNIIIDKLDPNKHTVDEKLVQLAKDRSADLYTTDYNLNQVASIVGVTVLNVNELAHALRPVVLPGEVIDIVIKQSGTNKDQGVGYLDDGTMVVVDNAIKDIGKKITINVGKSHQTVAGKMLFATKVITKNYSKNPNQRRRQ
jgi:uncharacterized protein YacL